MLDVKYAHLRNSNTLFNYLNNLHSTADKLKEHFVVDIKRVPEFKILRLIRNYFYHIDDISEVRVRSEIPSNMFFSHDQMIIIPLEVFAKSVKSFQLKNKSREKYVKDEFDAIHMHLDYFQDILDHLEFASNKPSFKLDGVVYELGFDLYKAIYNITNYIVSECKKLDALLNKEVIQALDDTYKVENNISKYNLIAPPGTIVITTMEGLIFPKRCELVK